MDLNKIDNMILDVLKEKKGTSNSIGLYHGDMGICFSLYMANKRNPSEEMEKYADELLDKVIEKLKIVFDPSFEHGLAGVGFGINYLHKQGCVDGDIDDILFHIDASIYKFLNDQESQISPHLNGLIGYLMYAVERLNNPFHQKDNFLNELVKNMFRGIIDKLYLYLPKELKKLNEDMFPTLLWDLPILFYYFGEALKTNVYNVKIYNMFRSLELYICSIIPYFNLNKILVANSLSFLNKRLGNERIKSHIGLLYHTVDYSHIVDEIDRGMNCVYAGWCNALINLNTASSFIDDEKILSEISNQKGRIWEYAEQCLENIQNNDKEKQKIDLVDGLSGLSLCFSLMPNLCRR